MNFVTLAFIRESMMRNAISVWTVYDERKKKCDTNQDNKLEPAKSFDVLKTTLESITGEFCRIIISRNKTEGLRGGTIKGLSFTYFYALKKNAVIENELPALRQPQRELVNDAAPGSYGFTVIQGLQEQNAVLREQLLTEKFEKQLEALSAQINAPAASSRVDRMLDLVLAKMLGKMDAEGITETTAQEKTPVAETINGTNTTPANSKEKLTSALNTLKSVDENFIDTIAKVAKLAKENPALFKEYIKQL